MRKIHVTLACLAVISIASAAQASLISYSDRVAWENSVSDPTTTDFNGLVTSVFDFAPSYSIDSVNFTVTGSSSLFIIEVATRDADYLNSGYLEWQSITSSPNIMAVTFDNEVSAFGFDFGQYSGEVADFQVSIGAEVFTLQTAGNAYSFFGVTSDTSLTSVDIQFASTPFPIIDNFSVAIPEPSTALLMGLGLLALGWGTQARHARPT